MLSINYIKSYLQFSLWRGRSAALTLAVLLCCALGSVLHAQGLMPPLAGTIAKERITPAGTIIRNHAIVQFQRMDDEVPGRIYDAPSNEVLIEILPVYDIEILPDGDAPGHGSGAPPGQLIRTMATTAPPNTRVVISYSLVFTGNASDNVSVTPDFVRGPSTFLPKLPDGDTGMLVFSDIAGNGVLDGDDVQIASWRDANSNGQVDVGEVQLTPLGRQFPPGTIFPLLLVFRVPANTPAGANCYVGVKGRSMADPTAMDPPSATSIQNIVQVQVVEDAVMSISKDANATQVVPDSVITYTVTAKSVGKVAAKPITVHIEGVDYKGIGIADIIPTLSNGDPLPISNMIPVLPSGVTGTFHYSAQRDVQKPENDPSWNWHNTYNPGVDTVIAFITSDGTNHHGLEVGQSVGFKFDATVPVGAQYTDHYPLINIAHCRYNTNGLVVQTVKSNELPVQVYGAIGVLIRDTDFEASRPPLTPADDGSGNTNDTQTVQVAQAGTFVYFTNRILNTGSGFDNFNISLHPDTYNPNNWTVTFFKSDGVTPMRSNGIGGSLDTALIAPAGADLEHPKAYTDIVLRVEIPEDAVPSGNPVEARFVVHACKDCNTNTHDNTTNQIIAVQATSMRLDNHYPVGSQAQDPTVRRQAGDPGKYVDFPLIVQNLAPANGEVDVYTLTTPLLPTGWSVNYYRDLNQDGVLQANELLPVLRSGAVAPQEKDYLIARVGICPYAIADADNDDVQDVHTLRFRATSSNRPDLYKEQDDEAVVNWQNRFELHPNRQGTIEAGGVTVYEHTVTNFGERPNRFYLTLTPGTVAAGWTYFLLKEDGSEELPKAADPSDGVSKHYIDLGEAGEPNDKGTFRLRLYAPANTPQGTLDLSSILVTANDPLATTTRFPGTPLHVAADITFVIAGDLVLMKSANPAPGTTVLPGQQITYTTTFFNKSTDGLGHLTIQDQISPHTAYVLQSASATPLADGLTGVAFEVSRDSGMSWTADNAGAGSSDPTVTNVRAVFTGALGGGAEGKFVFSVEVR